MRAAFTGDHDAAQQAEPQVPKAEELKPFVKAPVEAAKQVGDGTVVICVCTLEGSRRGFSSCDGTAAGATCEGGS